MFLLRGLGAWDSTLEGEPPARAASLAQVAFGAVLITDGHHGGRHAGYPTGLRTQVGLAPFVTPRAGPSAYQRV